MTAVGLRPLPTVARRGRWLVGPRMVIARLAAAAGFVALGWGRPSLVLPALLAVPLAEALVAWHAGKARRAFASQPDPQAVARYLHALGRRTLLALTPPVLVASALFAVDAHLPADRPLAHAAAARAAVGVLCVGGYALLLFLAAGRRLLAALLLGGLAAAAWTGLGPAGPWPAIGGYLVGLVLAGAALFDVRTFWPSRPRERRARRFRGAGAGGAGSGGRSTTTGS